MYVNGRKVSPELEKIGPIALTADGRTVAYPARVDDRWTVYVQDRKLAVVFPAPKLGSDGLRGLVLSGDGTRVAYAHETFQESELNYYGVPESSVVFVNETQVSPDFTAADFVVVNGDTLVFAGHDPRSHEIVVGSLAF